MNLYKFEIHFLDNHIYSDIIKADNTVKAIEIGFEYFTEKFNYDDDAITQIKCILKT